MGFGDRLGLASAAHVAVAAAHPDFVPFFAQSSAGRTPQETLAAATRAVGNARFRQPWGADADSLRTPHEVDEAAAAGFTYFTLDLSEHVTEGVDDLPPDEVASAVNDLVASGELPEDWASPYLDREVDVPGNDRLILTLDPLRRAAAKFGRAVRHGARLYEAVARANRGRPYEIEVSVDGIAAPVSVVDHLFLGLEFEACGVRLTSLALRFDERDSAEFEVRLREHVAVASFCGPYKLGFRGGSHSPDSLPVIGRCCGDRLHYKTTAESFVEALRLAWRLEPERWQEILSPSGFPTVDVDVEASYIDDDAGARRLDTVAGDLLAPGRDARGPSLGTWLVELLDRHGDMYAEMLIERFGRLIRNLNAG